MSTGITELLKRLCILFLTGKSAGRELVSFVFVFVLVPSIWTESGPRGRRRGQVWFILGDSAHLMGYVWPLPGLKVFHTLRTCFLD